MRIQQRRNLRLLIKQLKTKSSMRHFSTRLVLLLCLFNGSCSLWGRDLGLIDPALQKVSKRVSLGTYKPHDLVAFNGVHVSQRIVKDLKNLLAAAQRDGLTLKVVSGYR